MSDERKSVEQGPKPAAHAAESRRERLAAALRENLRRRKAQMRGRRQDADPREDGAVDARKGTS